jgi:endoglucanase
MRGAAARALLGATALFLSAAPALAQIDTRAQPPSPGPATQAGGSPKIKLGVFDPGAAFGAADLQIEHIFMPWAGVDLKSLDAASRYAADRKRELLVTLEPWSWDPAGPNSADDLKRAILAGRYDREIRAICGKLGSFGTPTTVRWGHEMDLKNARYPWANWNPGDYVAAYRYFVESCRAAAPGLAFMWSPRGEHDLLDYYPGDAFVDVVGISVFGLQAYDKAAFGAERDFAAIFGPSYELAATLKKPIVISEFGCSGDTAYVKRCMDLSAATLRRFPLLSGVIYFNEFEPGQWPAAYGKPDWRMRPETAARFRLP